jgi:hypothetical protein
MRAIRTFVLVLVAVLAATPVTAFVALGPVAAASFVQKCNGPPVSSQSGRINFSPGLNAKRVRQTLDARISLFECSPDRTSRGSGTFKARFMTTHPRACGLLNTTTRFKIKAAVIWKNELRSTLALVFTVAGRARTVTVSGKVSAGAFKGHKVTAAYKFRSVASPHPATQRKACANKVLPNGRDRMSVVALETFSTKPFVVS